MAALTALELGGESKNEFHNPRTSVELTEQKLEIAKIINKFCFF